MYLSKPERKEIIDAYDCGNLVEDNHYQVEPDIWVYLFRDSNNKKFALISADYLDYNLAMSHNMTDIFDYDIGVMGCQNAISLDSICRLCP